MFKKSLMNYIRDLLNTCSDCFTTQNANQIEPSDTTPLQATLERVNDVASSRLEDLYRNQPPHVREIVNKSHTTAFVYVNGRGPFYGHI